MQNDVSDDPSRFSLLVVDDEKQILSALTALLSREFDVLTAGAGEEAIEILAKRSFDLILTDQKLPGISGTQLLEWVREKHPQTMRLLMTGLGTFEDAVDAINCGQVFRFLFKPWRAQDLLETLRQAARTFELERRNQKLVDELTKLNRQLEERVRQRTKELERTNHELQQKNSMLEKLALTDPLTGIPNRLAMDRLTQAEIRRRIRYPSSLTLGILDIDNFKDINSRYLLTGGDQVLIELGKTLSGLLRGVDTIGRMGGEEFLLLAPETYREGAEVLAERLRSAVEKSEFLFNREVIRITISIGLVVVARGVTSDYQTLKDVAAAALAEAKTSGRNRWVIRRLNDSPKEEQPPG